MKDHSKKAIGSLIVVSILLSAGLFIFLTENGSELRIRVESTHIVLSAEYTLYVDNEMIETWTMGPGEYKEIEYLYKLPKSKGIKISTVKVVSEGGGIGTQTDTKQILVGLGIDYEFTLKA